MPNSSPDTPSVQRSSAEACRQASRAIYLWIAGSTLATSVTIVIAVIAGSIHESFGMLFSVVTVGFLHVWMFITAIGTVLGTGRSWIWQAFHVANLVVFSGILSVFCALMTSSSDLVAEICTLFVSSVILFAGCQLVYTAIVWFWRYRGYRLCWMDRSDGSKTILPANRQWQILDLMMATTLVAVLITALGFCFRVLAAKDSFFGPFFAVVIILVLGSAAMLLMLVLAMPPSFIYLSSHHSSASKTKKVAVHFGICLALWVVSLAFIQERLFTVFSLIAAFIIALISFGFQRWFFSGDQSLFPFSLSKASLRQTGRAD